MLEQFALTYRNNKSPMVSKSFSALSRAVLHVEQSYGLIVTNTIKLILMDSIRWETKESI